MAQENDRATHWTYVQEYRRCKGACSTCANGRGHGPYWYAKRKVDGKVVSRYVGKSLKRVQEDATSTDKV